MGGYVCLTRIDKELDKHLAEPEPDALEVVRKIREEGRKQAAIDSVG